MKKLFTLILGLLFVSVLPTYGAKGDGYPVGERFIVDNYAELGLNVWFVVTSDEEGHRTARTDYTIYENAYTGEITIPEKVLGNGKEYTVTAIGDSTFDRCIDLTKLVLPPTIEYIGTWGIAATGIKSLDIPAACVQISDHGAIAQNIFMTEINVDPANPNYASYNGALYSKNLERLIQVPAGVNEITLAKNTKVLGKICFTTCENLEEIHLPASVEEIEVGAFQYCSSLKYIHIPKNVTTIPQWCFGLCTDLESILLHDGIELIDYCAFELCTALKEISIPDTVEFIEESAFKDCTGLEKVRFGLGLTEIGDIAFENCTSLKEVTSYAVNPPTMGWEVFENVELSKVALKVMDGSKELYETADTWQDFGSITETEYNSAVANVNAENVTITSVNGMLTVNATRNESVAVYSVGGTKVAEGLGDLNVSLPKGLYIVVVAGETFKVMI